MADITRLTNASAEAREHLNDRHADKIASLTDMDIAAVMEQLDKASGHAAEYLRLKAEVDKATDKNAVIARLLDVPGRIADQLRDIIARFKSR